MAKILLCDKTFNMSQFSQQCGVSPDQLYCGGRPVSMQPPYSPYLIGPLPSAIDKGILTTLNMPENPRNLFNLANVFGADTTGAIADAMANLETEVAVTGAATSVYSKRMGEFGHAVKNYQDSLLAYRDTTRSSDASARAPAEQAARNAFYKMQQGFRQELSVVTSGVQSRKGTPLTSVTRGTNIARSSRSVAKLNVTSVTQAHNLVKFSNYGRYLGNGLVVIDFASRIGSVQKSYKADGDWERDLFIESSSFTLSAIAGTAVVKAGIAFLLVATPVGWVGLIVAGTAIVGTAAAASIWTNNKVKDGGGEIYDDIMNWINTRL